MSKRILITLLLVASMLVSVIALNSCDNNGTTTPGGNDQTGGEQGGEAEQVTKYTVSYVGGEGATGDAPASVSAKPGTTVILASNTFTRENYLFLGWTDGANTYSAGDVILLPEANVVLTAIWEEAPEILNEISSVTLNGTTVTVSGIISSAAARLCIGTDPENNTGHNFYQDLTVGDKGGFTASFDLASLKADEGWYNVHLLGLDGEGNVINVLATLGSFVDGSGSAIAKDTVIDGGYTNVKVVSWDGENGFKSLSFEVDYKSLLVGGKPSVSNIPFALVEEDGKVYVTFNGEFNGDAGEKTVELVLTYEDPKDYPALDTSKIVAIASNLYEGDNVNAFSFKVNMTDNIKVVAEWVRFVLKVTEGDSVTYYTVKPDVPSHSSDWHALAEPITVSGAKHELAICWSSVFVQVVNP